MMVSVNTEPPVKELFGNGCKDHVGSNTNRVDIFQHIGDISVNFQLRLQKIVLNV